jgi:diaminopimelate epimerase
VLDNPRSLIYGFCQVIRSSQYGYIRTRHLPIPMKREFRFIKYHGCGNDFILRDEIDSEPTSDTTRSKLAKKLTRRNFEVGADGILFIERAKGVDASMRLFEPAGNEADMCGNGIRCIAAYLSDKLHKPEIDILTRDGIKRIVREGSEYKVDMGTVRWRRKDLRGYITDKGRSTDSMLDITFKAKGRSYRGSVVNTGEPHIVARTKDIDSLDMKGIGDSVNKDAKRFPKGVNLNFVEVIGPHSIRVRTYERGVYDETLACGTGSTAAAAVSLMLGWVKPGTVNVFTRGGRIRIDMDGSGRAAMTGPAVPVFEGTAFVDI